MVFVTSKCKRVLGKEVKDRVKWLIGGCVFFNVSLCKVGEC
jgi:hypothetical protein